MTNKNYGAKLGLAANEVPAVMSNGKWYCQNSAFQMMVIFLLLSCKR